MLAFISIGRWGIPWRLAKQMTECWARFAMRVSRGPGSCSAVKLKCISSIPISNTPDVTILQMIRDSIRFSSTAGYKPRCAELFLQLRDQTREYKLVKEVGSSNGWVDRPVRIDSHRAIVHSHGLGEPESAINGAELRCV